MSQSPFNELFFSQVVLVILVFFVHGVVGLGFFLTMEFLRVFLFLRVVELSAEHFEVSPSVVGSITVNRWVLAGMSPNLSLKRICLIKLPRFSKWFETERIH